MLRVGLVDYHIMEKRMTRIRLLLLFICFDLNSQSFHPHFVNQIFVDGQLVYKDSFGVIDSSIKINYCDSNGLIVNS